MSEIKKIKKPRLTIPKCIYANWKFCWQRNVGNNHTFWVDNYKKPDPEECAACLSAFNAWGDGADRRPISKEEAQKERKLYNESQ
jgi:hypothetical protein